MSDLLDTPATRSWLVDAIQRNSNGKFGKLVPAVIWSDARNEAGKLLVPIDPEKLVSRINGDPYIILHNHDPGKPKGQIVESAAFETIDGKRFVAAVLGY